MEDLHWADRGTLDFLIHLSRNLQGARLLVIGTYRDVEVDRIDGRLEDVVGLIPERSARGEELGAAVRGRAFAMNQAFLPLLLLGRFQEAERVLDDISGLVFEDAARPLFLAYAGRTEEARTLLDTLLAEYNIGAGDQEVSRYIAAALLHAAVLAGHREAAELLLPLVMPFESLIGGFSMTCAARHLGEASALLGKPEQARAYYTKAIEVCQKVRFRPEIALTRLQLAELLLEHYPDEKPEALEHLDFAIAEFKEMKMQPSLERALKHKGLLTA